MYGQRVAPQTQNKRTSLSIRNAMRHTGVRVAAFGVCILMAGLLLLPGTALTAEMPEPDAATPNTCDETNRTATSQPPPLSTITTTWSYPLLSC